MNFFITEGQAQSENSGTRFKPINGANRFRELQI